MQIEHASKLNPDLSSSSGAHPALACGLLFHAKVDATSKDLLNVFIKVFSIHGTGGDSPSMAQFPPSAFFQAALPYVLEKH